ncbi:hypothetical protein PO909_005422 [Leuciscus waleckii]
MQGVGTLVLGTLLVSVFSAVSVHSSPLSSLPPASVPRVFLSFKGKMHFCCLCSDCLTLLLCGCLQPLLEMASTAFLFKLI